MIDRKKCQSVLWLIWGDLRFARNNGKLKCLIYFEERREEYIRLAGEEDNDQVTVTRSYGSNHSPVSPSPRYMMGTMTPHIYIIHLSNPTLRFEFETLVFL